MRSRFSLFLFVSCFVAWALPLSAAAPRKIVIIAGRKSHGPEGNGIHDYPWSARLLKVMFDHSNVRDQVRVEFHQDGWPKDPSTLEDADAIMVISDGRDGDKFAEAPHFASPEHAAIIQRQIDRGCGFLTFHFSTFAPNVYARQVLDWSGAYFQWETDGKKQWYSNMRVVDADVRLPSPTHPILRGVKPFHLREEFYFNLRFDPADHALAPLLEVPTLGGREPDGNIVSWARERANGGRGFGTTCGHFYANWQNDDFRKFILNAVLWSAHGEVPPAGVEASYYDHDAIMHELDRTLGREALPASYDEPAAPVAELTPAQNQPSAASYRKWERSHGNAAGARFSGLEQITKENVKQLSVAWTYHSTDGPGNIQCNPIIAEGRMYAPTPGGALAAIDASTGAEVWRFTPNAPAGPRSMADITARRGLLYWPGNDSTAARIFFTAGHWLYAVDAKTGEAAASFGDVGHTPVETGGTVAGAIFKQVLVLPGFDRDVFGYDVVTGKLLWTFHTLPHEGEEGFDTWNLPDNGANCWGGMALDEQRGIAYVSTGSPKPDFVGMRHLGRNLFANCVLALDAATGRKLWHFQEVRHDIWDWDIPAPPVLATIEREGRRVDVVAQATKLGNTFVLDRVTGKSVFPIHMRRAPVSKLPGEETWPYQPDPELPAPFTRQEFRLEDVTQRTPEAHDAIMRVVGRSNYGWFAPWEEAKPTVLFAEHGGAEWTGACVDPRRGRLYVNSNEVPWFITLFRNDEPVRDPKTPPTAGEQTFLQFCAPCHGPDRRGGNMAPPLIGLRHRLKDADVLALLKTGRGAMPAWPQLTDDQRHDLLEFLFVRDRPDATPGGPVRWTFGGWQKLTDPEGYPGCTPPWGRLNCLDLNTGRTLWQVPLGEYDELTKKGIPQTGTENFGGASVTAGGLVFCSGTRDSKIRAFDADTGAELWQYTLPWTGSAPPAIYEVNGREYIVIPATGGGKLGTPTGDAYVAFALPAETAGR